VPDPGAQLGQRALQGIDHLQVQPQHRAVMLGDAPAQRLAQLGGRAGAVPCASAARRAGSVSPATMASSIARPLLPSTSDRTLPSLRLASIRRLLKRLQDLRCDVPELAHAT
jgi:hypothetical protein